MNLTTNLMKKLMLALFLSISSIAVSQVNSYEINELGFLRSPMETKNGIVLSNNHFTEIYLLKDNQLTTLVKGRGCGIYTQMSKDKTLIGFKSINESYQQAPAILNVETGAITLLEDYCNQCGQVSFSNDGTMAYTMGNNLIIRKGDNKKSYDLGFYTNIANISPDATQVAYNNIDGRMFIIDLTTGKSSLIDVLDGYNGVWSPDGTKLAIHTIDGNLSVLDCSNNKIHQLGKGLSASWANNSTELIYTSIDSPKEMVVTGSSIKKVAFDGSKRMTLVPSSDNMPTDAIITSDNKLLVPYSTGVKRGLVLRDMPTSEIMPFSAQEETSLFEIEEDENFGARLNGEDKSKQPVKPASKIITPKSYEQTIGALDIPYLNQVYDVTAVNGCTKWGYVACGPTSACMFLGYFGLLDPVETTSRYSSSIKRQYAYHIGNAFTNQAKTTKFTLTATGNRCENIPGGYGFMWNTGSPQSNIEDFMKLNGCKQTGKTYDRTTAWNTFKKEVAAGRPYILCVNLGSDGHVILGFATNCYYSSNVGFVEKQGTFVCHDPYGDYNYSKWPNFDGQHSSYDWVGVNNGYANIGTYHWSVYAIPAEEGETVPELSFVLPAEGSPNPFAYDLRSEKMENVLRTTFSLNTKAEAVTVNIKDAQGAVVASANGSTAKGSQTVDIDITKLANGSYSWEVVVDGEERKAIQEFTALQFYHSRGVDVDNNMESENFGDLYVTEGMNPAEASDPTPYYSYNNSDGTHVGLYIFNPDMTGVKNQKTGKYSFMDDLKYTYISYGADLARVRVAEDGRIFVTRCNNVGDYILYAPSQADLVKNNNWTSLLSGGSLNTSTYEYTTSNGFLAASNVGLDVKGSGENLKLIALSGNKTVFDLDASGSRVDEYTLGNSTTLPTPKTVTNLNGYTIVPRGANVEYDDRGGIWYCQYRATPSGTNPALVYIDANGTEKYFEGTGGAARGGGGIRVSPDGKQIAIASATNKFSIYDLKFNDSGTPTITMKKSVIHGIGTYVNDIAWDLAGNLYICGHSGEYLKGYATPRTEAFTTKAASKYTFEIESSAIESIESDENIPVEYYNLQGVKVAAPENGVYIKKQGAKVTKVTL